MFLRFLATGDSFHTIAGSYRMGVSTVSGIVPDVAKSIWEALVDDYMPVPTTEDWRTIAATFQRRWNFPNCVGAIDGKHVVIQAPPATGSLFHNYKGTFSLVLLAVVDANKLFRVVDVGGYGGSSDGGILANSAFGERLQTNTLHLPEDAPLPGEPFMGPQPHVFVADEAFPLRHNLMRPYPGLHLTRRERIYNYRLSRARLVVENAFGILVSQWRLYHRVVPLLPANMDACIKATCILHNFMRRRGTINGPAAARGPALVPPNEADVLGLRRLGRVANNNAAREPLFRRECFASFFSGVGAVPWQAGVV